MTTPSRTRPTRTLKLSALAAGLLFSGISLADAQISADLAKKLATALPGEELTVVVSYGHSGPAKDSAISQWKTIPMGE